MRQSKPSPKRRAVLNERAHAMRHAPTPSEAALFKLLSGGKLGVGFKRQVPLGGRYIGDARYEPGWDAAWNQADATHGMYDTKADWDTSLACGAEYETWTPSVADNETRPINCINWYQAYAFCIWDGGFLPSEAEWNYAAAGGSAQREYPWSSPASSTTIDCTYANYSGCPPDVDLVGVSSPNGDGRYGQSDLAGNVWEWSLDRWSSAYTTPCSNCAHLPLSDPYGMFRGGSFGSSTSSLLSSHRSDYALERRNYDVGVRCARTP